MNSSGIRRGLAVAAVGALAALGIPHAAFADSVTSQMNNTWTHEHVTLYGPHPGSNQISIKNDGYNSKVTLEAGGTSDIDTMRFQYSTDGGSTWHLIGSVLTSPNDDGAWTMDWDPLVDSGIALGTSGLLVRANGHSTLDGADHPGTGTAVTFTNTQDTIGIAPGTQLGYWSTNGGSDDVILSGKASYNGTGTIGIAEPASGTRLGVATFPIASNAWKTIYDIKPVYTAAPFGYNAPDQVVMSATTSSANPTSGDTEGYTLYKQVITKITATAPSAPTGTANEPVTITVTDQNGAPIAGVNVSSNNFPLGVFLPIGTTNANGQVTTANQSVNDGSVHYVANVAGGSDQATEDAALGDKSTDLQVVQAFSTSLVGSSHDGSAFDFDENVNGDVTVQVQDQNHANFDVDSTQQQLTYHWRLVANGPAAGGNGETVNGLSHTLTSDVAGKFSIPALDNSDFAFAHGLESGTYELFASLSDGGTGHAIAEQSVLGPLHVGQAAIKWTDDNGDGKDIKLVGQTDDMTGKLLLEDGTPLPGRNVHVVMSLGHEYNVHDNSTLTPDAVIVSDDPAGTATDGTFHAMVEDLSTDPNEVEIGDSVHASAATSSYGTWGPYTSQHGVDFVANSAPAGSVVDVTLGAPYGPAGAYAPGTVHLQSASGDSLPGVQVTLTIPTSAADQGYFLNQNHYVVDPAAGNYVGEYSSSLGKTLTVDTDASGNATFFTGIGRSTGFDDDGMTGQTVTGAVTGATSDSATTTWTSDNPYNVSSISVVKTPDAHQTQPTNPATLGNPGVLYDVFAKDQFGNPARGVEVGIGCAVSDDADCPTSTDTTAHDGYFVYGASDFDNGGDFELIGQQAGDFHLTAHVIDGLTPDMFGGTSDTMTEVYDATLHPVTKDITTTFEQVYYKPSELVSGGATYTVGADHTSNVPTDSPVTVSVNAKDQKGNPLTDMEVNFVRTSSALNDQTFYTDGNGLAQYVFQGSASQCGTTDTVTAVVRDPDTETIVFTGNVPITFAACPATGPTTDANTNVITTPQVVPAVVTSIKLAGANNGKKKDKVHATVTAPAGAVVTLYKVVNGHKRLVAAKASTGGKVAFAVKDANGKKKTVYIASVSGVTSNSTSIK